MYKKSLIITLTLIIGFFALILWFKYVDLKSVFSGFTDLNYAYVTMSALLYLMSYFVRSLRWKVLLENKIKLSITQAFFIMMGGNFTNYLIPLRAGDLMRSFFIKKISGVRISETLPSVFIDKLFDMIGIFVVFILILVLRIQLPTILNYLLLLITALFVLSVLILVGSVKKHEGIISLLKKIFFFIPKRMEQKFERVLSAFISGLNLFKGRKRVLSVSIIYSLLATFLDGAFFYAGFFAFNISISFFYVLLGYTLIFLSYIIPHPPAQLGSNEWMMVLIFGVGFGMEVSGISKVMLFSHLLTGLLIVVFGLISYSYAGVRLLNVFKQGEELNE